MGAATKILRKQVDEANSKISLLNERIKVLEQEMISVKEFMKEALVQGKCLQGQSCNQGGRLVQMAPDAEGSGRGAEKTESDRSRGYSRSRTVSTTEEMGGNGGEEGGFKTLTEAEFNYKMMAGLCVRCDQRYRKNHKCRYKDLRVLVLKDEDCSSGPSTSKTVSTPMEMAGNGGEGGFIMLTEAEFNYKMKRGLCSRCDMKYRKNHKCRYKNFDVLVVEDVDEICDQEKKEKEEEPETVTGGAHQFKFLGKIGDREVIVLFGTDATHNFISRKLVDALQIPLERTRKFRVNKGAEESEVCERVVLKTHDIEIAERFFPTDIEIADVVLGNEWLKSIGRAKLQGNPMTLTFQWHGRTVTLQADPSLSRRDQTWHLILEWIQKD